MEATFAITNTTKTPLPRLPFEKMKNSILGNQYAVSLVCVGPARAKAVNMKWRKKSYVPNVLAFVVDKNIGEIYICPSIAEKEASEYDYTTRQHIAYLFIHALLHLKGLDHGDTMERAEVRYMRRFDLA